MSSRIARLIFTFGFVVILSLPPVAFAAPAAPSPQPEALAHYEVDTGHSAILFKVKRNGVSNFFGRFNRFSGTIDLLEKGARTSDEIALAIAVDSLDTGIDGRDSKLKNGKGLFAIAEFPKVIFTSTQVRKVGPSLFRVQGTLTFRGISQPVKFEAKRLGSKTDNNGGGAAGFEAVLHFDRSKFGMTGMAGSISDDVEVTVSLACTRKASEPVAKEDRAEPAQ